MKKIKIIFLSLILISLNIAHILPVNFEKLTLGDKFTYNTLIKYAQEQNIEEFVKLLGQKENFSLTNVTPNLAKSIVNSFQKQSSKKLFKLIYALFIFGTLSEVIQQIKSGSTWPRFEKINRNLKSLQKKNISLNLKNIRTILAKKQNNKDNSFWWYLAQLIQQKKITNPCLKYTFEWFKIKLTNHLYNGNLKKFQKLLKKIPYLVYADPFNNETKINTIVSEIEYLKYGENSEKNKQKILKLIKETKICINNFEPWFVTRNKFNRLINK